MKARWGETPGAPEHETLEKKLLVNPPIRVPTVMLHGENGADNLPAISEGKFIGGYERRVLPGVGHFIPREAPEEVLAASRQLLQASSARDVQRT